MLRFLAILVYFAIFAFPLFAPRMFSSRLKWKLEPNRLALLIAEKKRKGSTILDLTESNPTRAGFNYPDRDVLDALAQPPAMRYEPAPRGLPIAREAVASYYRERGFEVDPGHIHLTASTSEAYAFLFKLLTDPGQSVLVPRPSYPLFEFLAALEGVELKPYALNYIHQSGWKIDFDSVENAVTANTRAVIVVNPNNPTGSFIKRDEIERMNEICSRNDLALIADEVFSDYAFCDDSSRVTSLVSNDSALTFVMSGISKVLALPQMKLGWIVTNGPKKLRVDAIEWLDLIADTFLSVGAPIQHAAPILLELRSGLQRQVRIRVQDNLGLLMKTVEDSPFRPLSVEGGWYATLEVPRNFSEEEWVSMLLEKDDVLVHPGYFFDFPSEAYLVLSLLAEPETFSEAVNRICERV